MHSPTPPSLLGKRTRPDAFTESGSGLWLPGSEGDGDFEPTDLFSRPAPRASELAELDRFTHELRLSQLQRDLVRQAMYSPALRESKLLAVALAVKKRQDDDEAAKPAYVVDEQAGKNITGICKVVMASSKVSAYLDTPALQVLITTIAIARGFVPKNILSRDSNLKTLHAYIGVQLGQIRSRYKKQCDEKKSAGPAEKHQTVFQLAGTLLKETSCVVTVEVCGRVGLLNKVDDLLAEIRKDANGDSHLVAKTFAGILERDRPAHGVNNYDLPTASRSDNG
uniref:Uncharacterized protein n=1 Tax=Mycena chlorophos TaxID=658473 RepID=A0ABQ0LFW7_MYCCL|nr:predicted protein [Mycena chlorophos]